MLRSNPKTYWGAADGFIRMLGIGCMILLFLILFDDRAAQVVNVEAPANKLEIVDLGYENGKFFQRVRPTEALIVQASWSASIFQDDTFVCGGGGNGTYSDRPAVRFSPDDWTGGNCAAMVVGREYQAIVSWQSVDQFGRPHVLKRAFEFVHTEVAQ